MAVVVGDNINAAKVTQSAVYPLFILEYAEKIYTRNTPSIFKLKCSVVTRIFRMFCLQLKLMSITNNMFLHVSLV